MSWKGSLDLHAEPTTLIEITSKNIIRNQSGNWSTKVAGTVDQRSTNFPHLQKHQYCIIYAAAQVLLETKGFGYKLERTLITRIYTKEIQKKK